MSDLQVLLLVLLLIYLSECFCWVRRGRVVLRSFGSKHFQAVFPSRLLGNDVGGLVFLNPLPPFGRAFICRFWPLSISSQHISNAPPCSLDRATPSGATLAALGEIKSIDCEDGEIRIDGKTFAPIGDGAGHFAKVLKRIWKQPLGKRESALQAALRASLRTQQIEDRLNELQAERLPLLVGSYAMAVILFLGPTMAIMDSRYLRDWPVFLALLGSCAIWNAVTFFQAHRRLAPAAVERRWKACAIMLLTPTASIRACDALDRDALSAFDPLACAAVLSDEPVLRRFARRVLGDLAYPAPNHLDAGVEAVRRSTAQMLYQACLDMLRERKIDQAELLSAPDAQDPACRSYCPRCQTQYSMESGACQECGGVPLVPLKRPTSA